MTATHHIVTYAHGYLTSEPLRLPVRTDEHYDRYEVRKQSTSGLYLELEGDQIRAEDELDRIGAYSLWSVAIVMIEDDIETFLNSSGIPDIGS